MLLLQKKVSFHRLGICSFPPLNNDMKSIKIGIRRQNTFAMATDMYPTVRAHRTAHWLWAQSWQDHIFRVISFTKQQCKHLFSFGTRQRQYHKEHTTFVTRAQKIVTRIFNLTSNRLRIRPVSSVKGDSRLIACCGSMGTLSNIQKFCFCVDVTKNRSGERRSQNGVRGTGNAERRTWNKQPETGSRE